MQASRSQGSRRVAQSGGSQAVARAHDGATRACLRGFAGASSSRALRGSVASWLRGFGPAFTLVELIVVVTVIILILAVAVPGLSAMNAEARLTSAQQTISGVTTRAFYQAMADRTMTAVRFFPGEWDVADKESQAPGGRQHLAIYSYVGKTSQELPPGSGNFVISFGEYFERAKDLASVVMPDDVWAAPLEALSNQTAALLGPNGWSPSYGSLGQSFVLDGQRGLFAFNAEEASGNSDSSNFLNADDFLIVCDPETGARRGMPTPFHLRAYVPRFANGTWGYDADTSDTNPANARHWYQRYAFSGVVTYRREPFVALGASASGYDRQQYLQTAGRPYLIHRFSGGLTPGKQAPQ